MIAAFQAGIISQEEAAEEMKTMGEELGAYGKIEPDKGIPAEVVPPSAEVWHHSFSGASNFLT